MLEASDKMGDIHHQQTYDDDKAQEHVLLIPNGNDAVCSKVNIF